MTIDFTFSNLLYIHDVCDSISFILSTNIDSEGVAFNCAKALYYVVQM